VIPIAYIAHAIPGRLRLKIHSRRWDSAYFSSTSALLRTVPGVNHVQANAHSASLVIQHTGNPLNLLDDARREGLFLTALRAATPPQPRRTAERRPGRAGVPRVLPIEKTSTPIPPVGKTLLRFARANASNSAFEKLCNAYAVSRTLGNPWLAGALAGLAIYQIARGDVLSSALALIERYCDQDRHSLSEL
jgi:hypothetical protein